MANLVDSVRAKGVLQPILVRRTAAANTYEIVAGERRWRAAQKAQLHHIPVVIKELSDGESLELALIENIQRQDLNAIEEAQGYRRLMDEFRHTQEQLAEVIGKSRSHIANTLRLLSLPDSIKTMIDEGRLSAGHARAVLVASDPEARSVAGARPQGGNRPSRGRGRGRSHRLS
jgi:ParB family chromosome partitioning protein